MRNAFGLEIPSIREVLAGEKEQEYIRETLTNVLSSLDIPRSEARVEEVMALASDCQDVQEYERRGHAALKDVAMRIPERLTGRADLIHEQIAPYVQGRVLDQGCGDGRVGERLAKEGVEVLLSDVYQHRHVKETGLHFEPFRQGAATPFPSQSVDTTLLLTVMHHSDDPLHTLDEAIRVTRPGGRIVAIESVYGIDEETAFGKLSSEEQRHTNIFFDHFYNRLIHYSEDPTGKVNVPFNFQTPRGWESHAAAKGLRPITLNYLGIDQPLVPEYHTLHVWESPR